MACTGTFRQRGITLIELMIVVVIIAILAAVAYPAYIDYGKRARRAEATGALLALAALQEKFFASNLRYTTTIDDDLTDGLQGIPYPKISEKGYYNLSVVSVSADPAFTMQAAPVVGGPQAGDGNYRITSTGIKTWDKANDGTYSAKWSDR